MLALFSSFTLTHFPRFDRARHFAQNDALHSSKGRKITTHDSINISFQVLLNHLHYFLSLVVERSDFINNTPFKQRMVCSVVDTE